jgi:prepilin-type N-terminal cleavage/methylation domain-containing protein
MLNLKKLPCVKGGFSLSELVIALFLLSIALLAIAGVFFSGTTAIKKGSLMSHATDIAYNEKVYLETYDFDKLIQGLPLNITCVPGNDFFSTRYPRKSGKFQITCQESFYRSTGNLKILYIKVRVSNIPEISSSSSSGRNSVSVSLDVIVSSNKN